LAGIVRILLVENEVSSVETFREELAAAGIEAEVAVAASRDSALARLAAADFDVLICDLRIPSTDGALDEEDQHGVLVIREATASHPVTPILILSGFGSIDNIGSLVNRPERDLYGTFQPVPLVRHTPKKDYGRCVDELRTIETELRAIGSIVVDGTFDLTEEDIHALRIYSRPRGAATIRVEPVSSGLSGAVSLRVAILGSDRDLRGSVFAKVDGSARIDEEELRFRTYVNGVLPAGSFPAVADKVPTYGGRSALVYSLVGGDPRSLFAVLASDQSAATEIVGRLRDQEARYWTSGARTESVTVGEIRQSRGGREDLIADRLGDLDWQWLEQQEFAARSAPQHGDLHGENVLVDDTGRPFLIDFAQTGPAAASLDPVELELSLLFHTRGRQVAGDWPTAADLTNWAAVGDYAASSPVRDFVLAARHWAEANGEGWRPVIANAYGHSVRQLAYQDVDPGVIHALVSGLIVAWRNMSSEGPRPVSSR
jgi:CheY-like chemotaxis protein